MKRPPYPKTEFIMKNAEENEEKKYHQAGYDSYITGVCFTQMIRLLYAKNNRVMKAGDQFANDLLEVYRNKMYIVGIYDIGYFNLETEERLPIRDHIFYVTYPPVWTKVELYKLFLPYGGLFTIRQLNETSSLCALREPQNADLVINELIEGANSTAGFKVFVSFYYFFGMWSM